MPSNSPSVGSPVIGSCAGRHHLPWSAVVFPSAVPSPSRSMAGVRKESIENLEAVQAGYNYSWIKQLAGGSLTGDIGLKSLRRPAPRWVSLRTATTRLYWRERTGRIRSGCHCTSWRRTTGSCVERKRGCSRRASAGAAEGERHFRAGQGDIRHAGHAISQRPADGTKGGYGR